MIRLFRIGHRWLGVFAAILVGLAALSGWLLMHPGWLGGRDFRQVAADARDPRHLLAGGPQGLFRSTDGGQTWQDVTMAVPTEDVAALTGGAAGFAVAFREMGLWRSSDGYVWEPVAIAEGEAVSGLAFQGDKLVVLTSRALHAGGSRLPLAPSLRGRIHDWHTGWRWGPTGARLVEAGALILIVLTVSGLALFAISLRRRHLAISILPSRAKPSLKRS